MEPILRLKKIKSLSTFTLIIVALQEDVTSSGQAVKTTVIRFSIVQVFMKALIYSKYSSAWFKLYEIYTTLNQIVCPL